MNMNAEQHDNAYTQEHGKMTEAHVACRMLTLMREPCATPARHVWGSFGFCCNHFDEFMIALFDLKAAVELRRHHDLVASLGMRKKAADETK